ncbi:MAG TPA: LysR family transcriptional regulator [Candidatus Brocadiia bacterium]|nr:LysR family transcriptional regulator [Candidatus Brocadiia bacterium]
MALIWVICGAGRGVGKTHLSGCLREILPKCVNAKLGHGPAKEGHPQNYFRKAEELETFIEAESGAREHIIVESNAWARAGRGELRIFLESTEPAENPRKDADELRARANILLDGRNGPRQWQPVLREHLPDATLRRRVVAALGDQQRYLCGRRPRVRSKLWLEVGSAPFFGPGLERLLGAIEQTGTLKAAALSCGMSYRRAWELVKGAESRLGSPLLRTRPGGYQGGGSALSEEGARWLEIFRRLNEETMAFADARFAALADEVKAR